MGTITLLCTEHSVVKRQGDSLKVSPLYCNCWSCEECAPRRRRRLIEDATAGEPNIFITLTCNPKEPGGADAHAKRLVLAWKEIRRRARIEAKRNVELEQAPKGPKLDKARHKLVKGTLPNMVRFAKADIAFIAVFEATRKGEPHLHILARAEWIDQDWLSKQMLQYMNAPIVDVRKINGTRQIASYVMKYIGKQPAAFEGCKRYWSSKSWRLTPKPEYSNPDNPWKFDTIEKMDVATYVAKFTEDLCEVSWDRRVATIRFRPLGERTAQGQPQKSTLAYGERGDFVPSQVLPRSVV